MPNRAYIILEVTMEDADVIKYLEKMDENKTSHQVDNSENQTSNAIDDGDELI